MGLFSYLIENHVEIVAAMFAVHAAAVVIVNLTPTPADDKVVGKLYKVIEVFAGILTKIAKK